MRQLTALLFCSIILIAIIPLPITTPTAIAQEQGTIVEYTMDGKRIITYLDGSQVVTIGIPTYLRWDDEVRPQSELEYGTTNWPYRISTDATNNYIEAGGKTITIPKAHTTLHFSETKISPEIIMKKSDVQLSTTSIDAKTSYLEFPYSATIDSSSLNSISVGRFKFNAGNEHITIRDDTEEVTEENIFSVTYIEPKNFIIVDNKIRLEFLKADLDRLEGNIHFLMNSWTLEGVIGSDPGGYECDNTTYRIDEGNWTLKGEPVTWDYNGSSVTYWSISHNGESWLDRNLGASQVATAFDDAAAYGDLFQWGRLDDAHQSRTSGTTTNLSSTDDPGHDDFIKAPDSPYDWRSPQNDNLWQGVSGTNNPCPSGWRIPTETEWNTERLSWSENNRAGAYASPLKLTAAGYRVYSSASLYVVGSYGYYWSSTTSTTNARGLGVASSVASMNSFNRANGFSVRCVKDTAHEMVLIGNLTTFHDAGAGNETTDVNAYFELPTNTSLNITFLNNDTLALLHSYTGVTGTGWKNYSLTNRAQDTRVVYTFLTSNAPNTPVLHNVTFVTGSAGAPSGVPPAPTNMANTTGNFYVNHTWQAGSGDTDTDTFNISVTVNGVGPNWTNGTTSLYINASTAAHAWVNTSVWAYNTTYGNLSATSADMNTQIPNNPISLTVTENYNKDEGETVFISDTSSSDLDSDTPTYSCNRTDLFADFSSVTGKGNWTTGPGDAGTYYVDLGVSDGYGSTDNKTLTITINAAGALKYNISGYILTEVAVGISGATVTDNLTIDTNTSTATGYYFLYGTGYVNGTYNVSASKVGYYTNYTEVVVNGSDMTMQNITLLEVPTAPSITSWYNNYTNNTNLTFSCDPGTTVNFNATANQTITTWTWLWNSSDQSNNFDNITITFNVNGTHTVQVRGTNANGSTSWVTWTIEVGEEEYSLEDLYNQNALLLAEEQMMANISLFIVLFVIAFICMLYAWISPFSLVFTDIIAALMAMIISFSLAFYSINTLELAWLALLMVLFGAVNTISCLVISLDTYRTVLG